MSESPDTWPILARLLARLRTSDDKGLGDTIARSINLIPTLRGKPLGDAFKIVMHKLGKDCGCGDRQAKLNEKYPYE